MRLSTVIINEITTTKMDENTHSNSNEAQATLGTNTCGNNCAVQAATDRNPCSANKVQITKDDFSILTPAAMTARHRPQ